MRLEINMKTGAQHCRRRETDQGDERISQNRNRVSSITRTDNQ